MSGQRRAPLINPYKTFSGSQFDSWVGDLTSSIRKALNPQWKGKGRAPDEGPGVGGWRKPALQDELLPDGERSRSADESVAESGGAGSNAEQAIYIDSDEDGDADQLAGEDEEEGSVGEEDELQQDYQDDDEVEEQDGHGVNGVNGHWEYGSQESEERGTSLERGSDQQRDPWSPSLFRPAAVDDDLPASSPPPEDDDDVPAPLSPNEIKYRMLVDGEDDDEEEVIEPPHVYPVARESSAGDESTLRARPRAKDPTDWSNPPAFPVRRLTDPIISPHATSVDEEDELDPSDPAEPAQDALAEFDQTNGEEHNGNRERNHLYHDGLEPSDPVEAARETLNELEESEGSQVFEGDNTHLYVPMHEHSMPWSSTEHDIDTLFPTHVTHDVPNDLYHSSYDQPSLPTFATDGYAVHAQVLHHPSLHPHVLSSERQEPFLPQDSHAQNLPGPADFIPLLGDDDLGTNGEDEPEGEAIEVEEVEPSPYVVEEPISERAVTPRSVSFRLDSVEVDSKADTTAPFEIVDSEDQDMVEGQDAEDDEHSHEAQSSPPPYPDQEPEAVVAEEVVVEEPISEQAPSPRSLSFRLDSVGPPDDNSRTVAPDSVMEVNEDDREVQEDDEVEISAQPADNVSHELPHEERERHSSVSFDISRDAEKSPELSHVGGEQVAVGLPLTEHEPVSDRGGVASQSQIENPVFVNDSTTGSRPRKPTSTTDDEAVADKTGEGGSTVTFGDVETYSIIAPTPPLSPSGGQSTAPDPSIATSDLSSNYPAPSIFTASSPPPIPRQTSQPPDLGPLPTITFPNEEPVLPDPHVPPEPTHLSIPSGVLGGSLERKERDGEDGERESLGVEPPTPYVRSEYGDASTGTAEEEIDSPTESAPTISSTLPVPTAATQPSFTPRHDQPPEEFSADPPQATQNDVDVEMPHATLSTQDTLIENGQPQTFNSVDLTAAGATRKTKDEVRINADVDADGSDEDDAFQLMGNDSLVMPGEAQTLSDQEDNPSESEASEVDAASPTKDVPMSSTGDEEADETTAAEPQDVSPPVQEVADSDAAQAELDLDDDAELSLQYPDFDDDTSSSPDLIDEQLAMDYSSPEPATVSADEPSTHSTTTPTVRVVPSSPHADEEAPNNRSKQDPDFQVTVSPPRSRSRSPPLNDSPAKGTRSKTKAAAGNSPDPSTVPSEAKGDAEPERPVIVLPERAKSPPVDESASSAPTSRGRSRSPAPPPKRSPSPQPDRHRHHHHPPPVPAQQRRSTSHLKPEAPQSGSPATRSNCRFHKISIPGPSPPDLLYFIVPGCAFSDQEVMKAHDIVDCGLATEEEIDRKVGDLERVGIDAYLLGTLRKFVGLDLLREEECAYLPAPGEEIGPKPRKSLAAPRQSIRGTSPAQSDAGSSSHTAPSSTASSRLGASHPATPYNAKKKRARHSVRQSDATFKLPTGSSESDGSNETSETPRKRQRRGTLDSEATEPLNGNKESSPKKPSRKGVKRKINDPTFKPTEHSEDSEMENVDSPVRTVRKGRNASMGDSIDVTPSPTPAKRPQSKRKRVDSSEYKPEKEAEQSTDDESRPHRKKKKTSKKSKLEDVVSPDLDPPASQEPLPAQPS